MPSKENGVHQVWKFCPQQISHARPIDEAARARRVLPMGQRRVQGHEPGRALQFFQLFQNKHPFDSRDPGR